MVWCPVHNKYVVGRQSKFKHAHGSRDSEGCSWMRTYLAKGGKEQ